MGGPLTPNKVVDQLFLPIERIKAICFLQRDLEQQIYNAKKLFGITRNAGPVEITTSSSFNEINSYLFTLGELANTAKNEMEALYDSAFSETIDPSTPYSMRTS